MYILNDCDSRNPIPNGWLYIIPWYPKKIMILILQKCTLKKHIIQTLYISVVPWSKHHACLWVGGPWSCQNQMTKWRHDASLWVDATVWRIAVPRISSKEVFKGSFLEKLRVTDDFHHHHRKTKIIVSSWHVLCLV